MNQKIPPISRIDAEGTVYLRDGVTVAFFLPMPLDRVADQMLAAFDRYLEHTPAGILRWASVGADSEEFRPLTGRTIERCRTMLTREATRKRELTAFELFDGEVDGDAPTHGIAVLGNPTDPQEPLETNLVQLYFPSSCVAEADAADAFVGQILELSRGLPILYGYASPGLHWAESSEIDALPEARAIAQRYPGFDVQCNDYTRSDIGGCTRGARWLTWLGPELIPALGGKPPIRALMEQHVFVTDVDSGLLVRASRVPEMGDRNRREKTPGLRALAALLEPVTLWDEPALAQSMFAVDEPDFLRRWERRFLDLQ